MKFWLDVYTASGRMLGGGSFTAETYEAAVQQCKEWAAETFSDQNVNIKEV